MGTTFAVVKGSKDTALAPREPSRIGYFLQKQVLTERGKEGDPVRLTLRHVIGGKSADLVDSWDIRELEAKHVQDFSLLIYETARNDAEGYGRSVQRYIVQVYAENKPAEEPIARLVFQVSAGATDEEAKQVDSTAATPTGVLQMTMRLVEDLHSRQAEQQSVWFEGFASMLQAMHRQNGQMAEHLEKLMKQRFEDAEAREKAYSESWKRERETKMLDAKLESQKQILDGIKLLVPAVARRMGAIDPKAPIPADEAQMVAIAESMTPEQFESLATSGNVNLTDAQRVAFMEWIKFHVERAEKQKQIEAAKKPQKG